MAKPKVAFFDFASCEGCQLSVLNLENVVLDLIKLVDIVEFREAISDHAEKFDIAFIEGSLTREKDIARIKKIREGAKVLIAIGACACTGGVNAMKNLYGGKDCQNVVYGEAAKFDIVDTWDEAKPISAVVKVDFEIPGCPMNEWEFVKVVKQVLTGQTPHIPEYPVCVECKLKENECLFEKGQFCLGPITKAGCDAACPSVGDGCVGCRGLVPNPAINAEAEVLVKHKVTPRQVKDMLTRYNTYFKYHENLDFDELLKLLAEAKAQ